MPLTAAALAGCLQVETTVALHTDGSATITERVRFAQRLLDLGAADPALNVAPLLERSAVQDRAAHMGRGLTLVSHEVRDAEGGSRESLSVFRIADVNEFRYASPFLAFTDYPENSMIGVQMVPLLKSRNYAGSAGQMAVQFKLLKPGAGMDAKLLNEEGDALEILFQQNLSAVRDKLLNEFDMREQTIILKLGLTERQTPELLAALNEHGRVVLNPQVHGLVLPDQQLARLSGVSLAKLSFDPDGPQLPEPCNAIISLVPATTGTMRRAEGLYVLASDAPVRWRWSYLAAGDIRPSKPSDTATDILDFILGAGSETIKQKVSLPPAWSDLTVSIQFSPRLSEENRPRVDQLYFEVEIDSSPAPDLQRVLSVRASGPSGGAVTACSPGRPSGYRPTVI